MICLNDKRKEDVSKWNLPIIVSSWATRRIWLHPLYVFRFFTSFRMTRHFDSDSALWHALDLMSSRLFAIALSDNFEKNGLVCISKSKSTAEALVSFRQCKGHKKNPNSTRLDWIGNDIGKMGMILGMWSYSSSISIRFSVQFPLFVPSTLQAWSDGQMVS